MNTGNFIDNKQLERTKLSSLSCQELLAEKSRLESEIYKRKFAIEKEIRDKYDVKRALLKETFYKIGSTLGIRFIEHTNICNLHRLYDTYREYGDDIYLEKLLGIIEDEPELQLSVLYRYKRNQLDNEMNNELKKLF